MRWNRFVFSAAFLMCTVSMSAADSTYVDETHQLSRYEKRVQRSERIWASLIPTHFVLQNAGNMGVVSLGIGWSYGKHRKWETDLLFGYIPKHQSTRGKLTTTLKGNFIPWDICLNPKADQQAKGRWSFQPLTTSLYLNTVYGHEFWKSQPGRYPDKYYEFISSKFRLNLALGQRLMFNIPDAKRRRHSRICVFYEVGTCDLEIRSLFQDGSVPLKDILGLSLGVKFYTL